MIIAQRPIELNGRNFKVGDEIPEEVILPNRITALENNGMIKVVHSIESKKEIKKTYNPKKLSNLKKDELIKVANENGIDPKGLSNKEIVNAIITGESEG